LGLGLGSGCVCCVCCVCCACYVCCACCVCYVCCACYSLSTQTDHLDDRNMRCLALNARTGAPAGAPRRGMTRVVELEGVYYSKSLSMDLRECNRIDVGDS